MACAVRLSVLTRLPAVPSIDPVPRAAGDLVADEFDIHRRVDLAQQVVLRHAFLERHPLEFVLGERRGLKHDAH
ncbi:hypothetical protein WT92_15115 [Burkholderia stagnalis]|uniref:Uncharacterized protein n=1 Tax=Burkholderia stagnalis TaxID=1503054 RepID=A0A106NRG9_9BURK|nr:hypothetical protein WT43_28090 [Burkholderia stagnalis]KWA54132.1 hypothetical protein WT44_29215 [Burkholderia stagnalis]KWA54693.1 hypothetical protein WT42_12095 [Burkholderia stagnalis]KWD03339.1 hypothetical protein WT45_08230 [Burkholderia stagnalis]KWD05492.1 hypothetical protein WT46_12335 [Burkholderia stagnalis]